MTYMHINEIENIINSKYNDVKKTIFEKSHTLYEFNKKILDNNYYQYFKLEYHFCSCYILIKRIDSNGEVLELQEAYDYIQLKKILGIEITINDMIEWLSSDYAFRKLEKDDKLFKSVYSIYDYVFVNDKSEIIIKINKNNKSLDLRRYFISENMVYEAYNSQEYLRFYNIVENLVDEYWLNNEGKENDRRRKSF